MHSREICSLCIVSLEVLIDPALEKRAYLKKSDQEAIGSYLSK